MKRILAALTHQSVPIEGKTKDILFNPFHCFILGVHLPSGKNFVKLRAGTLGSCLTFLMNMYDAVVEADNLQVIIKNPTKGLSNVIIH